MMTHDDSYDMMIGSPLTVVTCLDPLSTWTPPFAPRPLSPNSAAGGFVREEEATALAETLSKGYPLTSLSLEGAPPPAAASTIGDAGAKALAKALAASATLTELRLCSALEHAAWT